MRGYRAVLAAAAVAVAIAVAGCCQGYAMEGTARADRGQWRYSSLTVLPFEVDPAGVSGDPSHGPEYVAKVRGQIVDEVGDQPPAGPAPLWMRGRALVFRGRPLRRGLISLPGENRSHITLEISFVDRSGRTLARGIMKTDYLEGDGWDFGCVPRRQLALGAADFFHKHFEKI